MHLIDRHHVREGHLHSIIVDERDRVEIVLTDDLRHNHIATKELTSNFEALKQLPQGAKVKLTVDSRNYIVDWVAIAARAASVKRLTDITDATLMTWSTTQLLAAWTRIANGSGFKEYLEATSLERAAFFTRLSNEIDARIPKRA